MASVSQPTHSVALLLTTVPLAPGGAGSVDIVLIGMLVAFGADPAQATAVDIVWRAFCFLPQMIVGWIAVLVFIVERRIARHRQGAKGVAKG